MSFSCKPYGGSKLQKQNFIIHLSILTIPLEWSILLVLLVESVCYLDPTKVCIPLYSIHFPMKIFLLFWRGSSFPMEILAEWMAVLFPFLSTLSLITFTFRSVKKNWPTEKTFFKKLTENTELQENTEETNLKTKITLKYFPPFPLTAAARCISSYHISLILPWKITLNPSIVPFWQQLHPPTPLPSLSFFLFDRRPNPSILR